MAETWKYVRTLLSGNPSVKIVCVTTFDRVPQNRSWYCQNVRKFVHIKNYSHENIQLINREISKIRTKVNHGEVISSLGYWIRVSAEFETNVPTSVYIVNKAKSTSIEIKAKNFTPAQMKLAILKMI